MLEFTNYEFAAILVSVGTLGFTIGVKVGSPRITTEHKSSCHIKADNLPAQHFKNTIIKQPSITLFMVEAKAINVICPFYENKICTATGEKCIKL